MKGEPEKWREYFTADAKARSRRKDVVAYGVNMANIFKRLGLQVAVKGSYLKGIGVPFYVVMQHRPFEYLRRRIRQQLAQRRAYAHAAQRQRVEGAEVGQHQHAEHGA